ncbi:MAG: hypothetical protein Tsb0010_07730 [Parvularculaceae bacterium]
MTMRFPAILLALAAIAFGPAQAAGDGKKGKEKPGKKSEHCELSIIHPGAVDVSASSPYDAFSPSPSVVRAPLQIRAKGPACAFAIGFASANDRGGDRRLAYRNSRLSYWASPDRSGTVKLGDATQDFGGRLLRGEFRGGETVIDLPYFLFVPGGQPAAAAGRYDDRLSITLYRLDGKSLRRADSADIQIRLSVEPAIEATVISDAGAGPLASGTHLLRLGDLTRGARRDFQLAIRANTEYRLRLESEHRGALRHKSLGARAEIPYALAIDGAPAPLGRPFELESRRIRFDRIRKTLTVTAGPAESALAGEYSDNLKITIIAR